MGYSVAPARPAVAAQRGPRGPSGSGPRRGRCVRISSRGAQRLFPGRGRQPSTSGSREPESSRFSRGGRNDAVGTGVAEECWQELVSAQPAGRCRTSAPGQDPTVPGPGAKPLPLSQVSSRVWPGLEVTWMLEPGPRSHAPFPSPGALSRVHKSSRSRLPLLREMRPLLEWSRLLAQRLPPGYLPSDGRLGPLCRIQETFISVSPSLLSSLSPLLSLPFFS